MKRLATLVACLLLAGCSAAPASTPAVTTTSPAATTTTSTPLALGQSGSTSSVTFTASERKTFSDSRHVQAIMVKGCLHSDRPATPFTYMRWNAYGPDGERYTPVSWSDIQPSYPAEETVQPGACVKGWIQFDTSDKLATLRYSNDAGETLVYALA